MVESQIRIPASSGPLDPLQLTRTEIVSSVSNLSNVEMSKGRNVKRWRSLPVVREKLIFQLGAFLYVFNLLHHKGTKDTKIFSRSDIIMAMTNES